ncbi:MAG: glycosyltransferase family 2 protein [Eubacteriales bacterium]|nr:glycosyltransferase family 2 protein [Eubacteriales bacterium]
MNKLTVIIPNYNGLKFMDMCMSALREQSFSDYSLLIVDNGSTDGSVEYIKELSMKGLMSASEPDIKIPVDYILLKNNTGFSGAVNAGISACDSEYIILLNNDTKPYKDYIKELVDFMDSHKSEKCFAASPKMSQLYHPELLDDAGDGYNLLGWGFQRGVGQNVNTQKFCKEKRIFSACAGASIYNREMLEKIKFNTSLNFELLEAYKDSEHTISCFEYFDDQHFAYLEDIDVSYRANRAGFSIYYCPTSEILHVGSGTSGSKYNDFKVKLAARNNIFLIWKNMPFLQLILNLPFIAVGTFIKYLFFIKNGFKKAYADGFKEGLANIRNCKKKPAKLSELPKLIYIEYLLIRDSFDYASDFLMRKLHKD